MKMKSAQILFLLTIWSFKSFSCGCYSEQITQEDYDNYTLIFIGTIVEAEDCDRHGYQQFAFEVSKIFKGQTTKIVEGINNCGGSCNNLYTKGQEWLIYSNPEFGMIKDQYACMNSIMVKSDENKYLIGTLYHVSKQFWNAELIFLKSRISSDHKIVSFQFVSLIPLITKIAVLGLTALILVLCFQYKKKSLLIGIIFGFCRGMYWHYLHVITAYLALNEFDLRGYVSMAGILVGFSLFFISNIVYNKWEKKETLNFKKSFIINFIEFVLMVLTVLYMKLDGISIQDDLFQLKYLFQAEIIFTTIGIGVFVSGFTALFFENRLTKVFKRKRV